MLVFDEPRSGAWKQLPRNILWEKSMAPYLQTADWRGQDNWDTWHFKRLVGHIPHDLLGMRKLSGPWVQLLFTPDTKHHCEITSEQCLALFKNNLNAFLRFSWLLARHDILRHTREQGTVETMHFTQQTCSEVVETSYRLGRWWIPFSGIHLEWSALTT